MEVMTHFVPAESTASRRNALPVPESHRHGQGTRIDARGGCLLRERHRLRRVSRHRSPGRSRTVTAWLWSGELTPKVWTDKNGEARPALDMVAHAVLTAYHVARKRQAVKDEAA